MLGTQYSVFRAIAKCGAKDTTTRQAHFRKPFYVKEKTMRWFMIAALMLGINQSMSFAKDKKPSYPPTKKDNVIEVLHGVRIVDPYRWLEGGNSDDVKAWVDEQNKLTQAVLGRVSGRDRIHERLGSLIEIGRLGAPTPAQRRSFYTMSADVQTEKAQYVAAGATA